MKKIRLVLGNQLFPRTKINLDRKTPIFMCEDNGLCTYIKHHKAKIALFFCAMREYRDELISEGYEVIYKDCNVDFTNSFTNKLRNTIKQLQISTIECFEIEDKLFESEIIQFCAEEEIELNFVPSPMFLDSRDAFKDFVGAKNSVLHGNYYKKRRKELNILISDGQPQGGKWTFDEDNRKKIPKDYKLPKKYKLDQSRYFDEVSQFINKEFADHPGELNSIMPYSSKTAKKWLSNFLKYKFNDFGPYEDAIYENEHFLLHSALSSSLNLGIITPDIIIEESLTYAKKNNIPINSLEGFIRQIIGWREFIRGMYQNFSTKMETTNFWQHTNKMNDKWYEGTTGIPPLDDAIHGAQKYGYTHHINRLMVLANIMNLCRLDPKEIYKWFMEMFVDSSDWVMVPNVFGMGTFSDGGTFSTKPYICGSSYMLRMSNFSKGEWCDVVDGLYWKFIEDNQTFFVANHRLSLMINALNKLESTRKEMIFDKANTFIRSVTE